MWKAGIAAALAVFAMSSAQAQETQCAPRQAVIEALGERFGEARQSVGMDSRGVVAEVWANQATGTWTMTITGPEGITCIVAHGDGFEALDESPQGATF